MFKNNAAALAPESFEAALRIHEGEQKHKANDGVENDSGEFAETRFVDFDQFSIHRAGADSDVIFLERGQKLAGFLNRSGEVGVGEKDSFSTCFLHAVTHTVAFAAILAILENAEICDSFAEGCRDFRSTIR